jgi:DNA-3-methyladenine glycosylase II
MGLSSDQIKSSLDALARKHAPVRKWVKLIGYPEPRKRKRGYNTLIRTLIGQQVSVAAANGIYRKLEGILGDLQDPEVLLAADDETLRSGGLSRQKIGYARSLAEAVVSGSLNFRKLPKLTDEEAIDAISQIKGFGRWSAEIYLMFAEGRADIFPANDLAVQEGLKRMLDLPERPKERACRELGEIYGPHRTALALFTWHVYAVTSDQMKATL